MLLSTACLGGGDFDDPRMELQVDRDHNTLSVDDQLTWFRNSIEATDYQSWATEYPREQWRTAQSSWRIDLRDGEFQWPTAYVTANNVEMHFSRMEYGFGWTALYLDPEQPVAMNLNELGLVPNDANATDCELRDARLLFSLSSFTGSADNLITMGDEAANDRGASVPNTWHELVREPAMYDFLFVEKASARLRDTTFAYLALQLDPVCGGDRIALRSEQDLVGFVQFSGGSL